MLVIWLIYILKIIIYYCRGNFILLFKYINHLFCVFYVFMYFSAKAWKQKTNHPTENVKKNFIKYKDVGLMVLLIK